jgi:hypothetical protein
LQRNITIYLYNRGFIRVAPPSQGVKISTFVICKLESQGSQSSSNEELGEKEDSDAAPSQKMKAREPPASTGTNARVEPGVIQKWKQQKQQMNLVQDK